MNRHIDHCQNTECVVCRSYREELDSDSHTRTQLSKHD